MPIGILNNIPSLEAENELTLTASALNSTLEQLSSGSRINSGADDPAGLSIANGLEANISALTQSVSNANDGVGELQLADGALAQVTNLLNTAVTLATESATGTVSNAQRTAIQAQYASILAEINQIGTATTYNGQSVFQSGSAPNLNAADSINNATTAPITLNTSLTPGSVTLVQAGGVTFTFTAGTSAGGNLNQVTGGGTGLTAASAIASGSVVTATRATGTTTYTASAATTVGALLTAINTGTTGGNITVAGTDATHTGYTAQLVSGSLQITDLNNNNDLAVVETGGAIAGQVATTGENYTTNTNLVANSVLTIARTGGLSATYTVGSSGATVGQLVAAITTGTSQGTVPATTGITVAGTGASVASLTGAIVNGNLQITDGLGSASFTAVQTLGTNPNLVLGTQAGLTGATALGAGDVFTATRGGNATTYTVGSAGATVTQLLAAVNTGLSQGSTPSVSGITVGGAAGTSLAASLASGKIQVVDNTNSGNLTFTESGTPNPASQVTTVTGAGLATGTVTAAADAITLTNTVTGLTQIFTATNADTVGSFLSVINGGTVGNIAQTGTDTNVGEYTASFVTTGGGTGLAGTSELEITNNFGDAFTLTQGAGTDIVGTDTPTLYHAANTTGTYADNGEQLTLAANSNPTLGTFTTNTSTPSTVQSLVNAINSDTTVGAKAAVVGGQLVVTDPLDRNDLTVSSTDTVLGALVSGAFSPFLQPTNTGTATPDTNAIVGNAGSLTADSTLTGVTSFTAGGKTFTFTANGQPGGDTVGDLINAINSPTDAAGLSAYLTNGNLEVVDPNNNGNIAVGPANTQTTLGTFANPSTTASSTTNIFLSDSTAIGSTQIAVNIGGLSTAGITNGSGTGAVNLSDTDLSSQADAQAALVLINGAITNVASVRGTLGASVNRLTAASNVINSQVQNLTSAENTITAADIPTVVANLTKYSILEQTGISALAQANQQQQLVLKLLQ
jgi:flagellin